MKKKRNGLFQESVSIVMPCLNEESSVGSCVKEAKTMLHKYLPKDVFREILVVDNNSTDRSFQVAQKAGARVIQEPVRGYGSAYQTGIKHAKGTIIIMADCDGSYDFHDIPNVITALTHNPNDLILGSRFLGAMASGSMPFVNRVIGNPILTILMNMFYGTRISDSQTGFRAARTKVLKSLDLKSTGMEFASEMIIKAVAKKYHISEVPIAYKKRVGMSKLSPLSDALRHIQAILIFSPTYAIIMPGILAIGIGTIGTLVLLPGPLIIGAFIIDIHTLTMSTLLAVLGFHITLTGIVARVYTVKKLGIPGGPLTEFCIKHITFLRMFTFGCLLLLIASIVIGVITFFWILGGFDSLNKSRELIAASGLAITGAQLVFSSLLYGLIIHK